MPVHDGIFQIETFQITDGGRLDLFWEAEVATKRSDFGDVQFHEKMFLLGVDELDI